MSVRRLLAALGAMVLLGGCGGDPQPKVDPTPTSPPISPTKSETAEPASAEEFVREWVELSNEMQVSGDTAEYRDLSARCKPCLRVADRVEHVYESGGHIETSGLKINRLKLQGSNSSMDVDLYGFSGAVRIIKPNGNSRLPGGPAHFLLSIERDGSTWVATNLGLYES